MRKEDLQNSVVVLLLVTVAVCSTAIAEEYGDFDELTLRISTTSKEVLPLEPIRIRITLSNKTDKPIKGHSIIQPGTFLNVYVGRENQPFEQFRTSDNWATYAIIGTGDTILKAGFKTTVAGYLYYSHPPNLDKQRHGSYLFEVPGTYRIKAMLRNMDETSEVESNIITISVNEPAGNDAFAYEYIKALKKTNDEVAYNNFLMANYGSSYHKKWNSLISKQEEMLRKYPNSRYSRYVTYSLGLTYNNSKDDKISQRGVGLLEKAAGYKDCFIAEDAYEWLIRQCRERGEEDKAKEYQAQMAARFPNSQEGRDYLEEMYIQQQEEDGLKDIRKNLEPSSNRGLPLLLIGAVVVIAGLLVLGKKRGV